jgi:DNA polymerase-3 subunit delta'
VDRRSRLEDHAGAGAASLQRGIELVADTRMRLALNVSEELALEALAYRLQEEMR